MEGRRDGGQRDGGTEDGGTEGRILTWVQDVRRVLTPPELLEGHGL